MGKLVNRIWREYRDPFHVKCDIIGIGDLQCSYPRLGKIPRSSSGTASDYSWDIINSQPILTAVDVNFVYVAGRRLLVTKVSMEKKNFA